MQYLIMRKQFHEALPGHGQIARRIHYLHGIQHVMLYTIPATNEDYRYEKPIRH